MKLVVFDNPKPGAPDVMFECPGCECHHGVWISHANGHTGAIWGYNNNPDKPTFTPSLLVTWNQGPSEPPIKHVCHSFVTDGNIQFLGDCTHKLAGQTVPLPEIV